MNSSLHHFLNQKEPLPGRRFLYSIPGPDVRLYRMTSVSWLDTAEIQPCPGWNQNFVHPS